MPTDIAPPPLPLFFDMTVPSDRDKPPAALYLSEYLVKLIGSEVTTFRRNTLASYHFVDTAHHVVAELQQLIDDVFKKGTPESFSKWTRALTPLEKLLIGFDRDDFIGSNKLIDVSSPLACREDFKKWKNARDVTHQKLQPLHDEGNLNVYVNHSNMEPKTLQAVSNRTQDLKEVYRRDDQAFLNDLVSEIKLRVVPEDSSPPQAFRTFFEQLPNQVSKIANLFGRKNKFTSEPEALVVIQSMMAICGWSHFATKSAEDVATLKHMWSEPVCSSAERLLEGLIGLGEESSETKTKTVQDLYQEFIDLAFGVPSLSCVDLTELLDKIGRAYHSQALALITLCEEAVKYCDGPAETKDLERVKRVGQVLDQTSKVLTGAAKTANDSADALGLPHWILYKEGQEYDQDERSVQFQTAMTTAVETLTTIGLGAAAIKGRTDFEAAVKEDKNRAKQANERMAAIKAPEDAIKVTVNVRKDQQDGPILDPPHTGGWTLVSTIEWGVSSIAAVKQELTGKSARFELNGTPIAKDQTIGELAGSEQALTLDMVITGNPVGPMDEVTVGGATAEAAPTGEAAAAGLASAKASQVTKARQRRAAFDIALEERQNFMAKEVQRIVCG
ncbi:hypothetical protein FRC09_004886 [Ceratobasidium sp. 395]|nr:hypothetical protein FRC09_004886 [Ceratobasidium sp. 395]